MKRFSFILFIATILVSFALEAQTKVSKDFLGKPISTQVKALSSHLTDTSAVYEIPAAASGIVLGGQVDTGKVTFILQASMNYSATAANMRFITVDSLVGATAASFKVFTNPYPYVRVIRSRWTGGATKWGCYSGVYILPYGVK